MRASGKTTRSLALANEPTPRPVGAFARMRGAWSGLLRLALCLTGLLAFPLPAHAQEPVPEPVEARQVAVLKDRRINEASGLAASRRHEGVFWTHNDSGGEPCLFGINLQGDTVAKVRLPGAVNFDWEDIATHTDAEGRPWIYVADIGDNLRLRPSVQVYQIPEPDLPAEPGHEYESAKPQLWRGVYPDGRHDAECLLVHPSTGRIYIITRSGEGQSAVYAFPELLVEGSAMKLEKVAALTIAPTHREGKRPRDAAMITAGSISDDGTRLVLSTYSYLHEWTLRPGEPLNEALARQPRILIPPLLRQLEGICHEKGGHGLWLISEQLPTPLFFIPR